MRFQKHRVFAKSGIFRCNLQYLMEPRLSETGTSKASCWEATISLEVAVDYNVFSHQSQWFCIGPYFASQPGSRGGASAISNPEFIHAIFCCYLQQFVGGVDSVLFFTMVFEGFLIRIVIYNGLFGMPVKLLLFTISLHPMFIDFYNDNWCHPSAGWALGGRCCSIFGCRTLLQKIIDWKVFAAPWHVVRSPRRLCIIAHIVVISPQLVCSEGTH